LKNKTKYKCISKTIKGGEGTNTKERVKTKGRTFLFDDLGDELVEIKVLLKLLIIVKIGFHFALLVKEGGILFDKGREESLLIVNDMGVSRFQSEDLSLDFIGLHAFHQQLECLLHRNTNNENWDAKGGTSEIE